MSHPLKRVSENQRKSRQPPYSRSLGGVKWPPSPFASPGLVADIGRIGAQCIYTLVLTQQPGPEASQAPSPRLPGDQCSSGEHWTRSQQSRIQPGSASALDSCVTQRPLPFSGSPMWLCPSASGWLPGITALQNERAERP